MYSRYSPSRTFFLLSSLSKKVCKTKHGMMPADTELTNQLFHTLSLFTLFLLNKFYKIQQISGKFQINWNKIG